MMSLEQIKGSLFGLAIGDALGFPHEFRSLADVKASLGARGITDFVAVNDERFVKKVGGPNHPAGTFTDDTQMTLALTLGLLDAKSQDLETTMNAIAKHFIEWSMSPDNNRAPGNTCMRGAQNLARGIHLSEAGIAESKGCGSIMRVAPFAWWFANVDDIANFALDSSRLTHRHNTSLVACAAGALMVHFAALQKGGEEIHKIITHLLSGRDQEFDLLFARVPHAVSLEPDEALRQGMLGESWIAEEAAASALYSYWRHENDYAACVLEGANSAGDSDSIAAIAGSISGARLGFENIPQKWRADIEKRETLLTIAERVAIERPGDS